jgi:hypothetical protein
MINICALAGELMEAIRESRPINKTKIIQLRIKGLCSFSDIGMNLSTTADMKQVLLLCQLCDLGFIDGIE